MHQTKWATGRKVWQGTVTPSRRRTPGSIPGSPTISIKNQRFRSYEPLVGRKSGTHVPRIVPLHFPARHFSYRFLLPFEPHPSRSSSHFKISLGTREPMTARQLSRYHTLAGRPRKPFLTKVCFGSFGKSPTEPHSPAKGPPMHRAERPGFR